MLGAWDQFDLCVQDNRARALAADQRAGDVKAVLRQQLIEVVPGDPPRNVRKPFPDQSRVSIANIAQPRVDGAPASAAVGDGFLFGLARFSDGELCPVVQQDSQLVDVVNGLTSQQRMRAARVVSDHAAKRATAVRRGIRPEGQLMRLRLVAQSVEDDARFYSGKSFACIQLRDPIHIFREVEHDRDIAALACQARARPARQNRRAEFPANGHGSDDIVGITRHDQTNRNLTVIGGVGRVERPAATIEPHLTAHCALELARQLRRLRKRIDRLPVRAQRKRQHRVITRFMQRRVSGHAWARPARDPVSSRMRVSIPAAAGRYCR